MTDNTPESMQFPAASLNLLVSTLATQALVALGQMDNPATNKAEKNLPLARHLIDSIDVLQQKTTGNRSDEESRLLEGALHQLRMMYVSASESK